MRFIPRAIQDVVLEASGPAEKHSSHPRAKAAELEIHPSTNQYVCRSPAVEADLQSDSLTLRTGKGAGGRPHFRFQ
jgi:hypothetical protein